MSLAIIFDGNYLFYRSLYSINSFNNKKRLLDSEMDKIIFIQKMVSDFVSTLNNINKYDYVIITKDSKSWRQKLLESYKMNRKDKTTDSNVNWTNFFECTDIFLELLESKNIIVSKLSEAEGDDLICLWSKKLNELNIDTMIISGDSDLTQLVDFNEDAFTVVFNNKASEKKIIAPTGFYEYIQTKKTFTNNSLLSLITPTNIFKVDSKEIINDMISSNNYEEIDPKFVAIQKIICGDDGDNIPSIWEYGNIKENGKYSKRITNRHFVKLKESVLKKINSIDELLNLKIQNKIRIELESMTKESIDSTIFTERLVRNVKLVYLNCSIIPKVIQENFNNVEYQLTRIKHLDKNLICENTKYEFKNNNINIVSTVF